MPPQKTNLDLVKECDSFPYFFEPRYESLISSYYRFKVDGCSSTLGYMPPEVVQGLRLDSQRGDWSVSSDERVVLLHGAVTGNLDEAFDRLARTARDKGWFKVLNGWRSELYGIYGPHKRLLLKMERSATPLFGVVSYGVHMTGYVKGKEGDLKIWVPRRARTKPTYGGMLDNTVAGGISVGEDVFESLVREAHEEASLPEDVVRKGATACGAITYFHIRDERAGGETGLCQPECQYTFDLELPPDVVPKPCDDEVKEFLFMDVEQVKAALAAGEFKPNCAVVLLDFFIRHGMLRPDNEEDYVEVITRTHRRLEFPTM